MGRRSWLTLNTENYWTPKQAAAYLGVHHRTMLKWLRDGVVKKTRRRIPPHTRISANLILIPIGRFKKWVDPLSED